MLYPKLENYYSFIMKLPIEFNDHFKSVETLEARNGLREIIEHMYEYGGVTAASLQKELSLPSSTVYERISRLETENLIERYELNGINHYSFTEKAEKILNIYDDDLEPENFRTPELGLTEIIQVLAEHVSLLSIRIEHLEKKVGNRSAI